VNRRTWSEYSSYMKEAKKPTKGYIAQNEAHQEKKAPVHQRQPINLSIPTIPIWAVFEAIQTTKCDNKRDECYSINKLRLRNE
jgi:hypothetical protein